MKKTNLQGENFVVYYPSMGMYAQCVNRVLFPCERYDRRIAVKQRILLPVAVLAAAVVLFGCYLFWAHNAKDLVAPVITVEEGILECLVSDPQEKLLAGVTAWDDRDGDVTASLLVESIYGISDENVTTVTYAAFDRAGNVSKVQRQVRYTDYRAPRFVANRNLCFAGNSKFDLLRYIGADDVLDGDIRRRVRATLISDTKSINELGSHVVRLQVTNSLGDTVEADIPVEVYDPEWYTASVELKEYLIYLDKGAFFNPKSYMVNFVVRGDEINLHSGVPSDITCVIGGEVNTNVPGVYAVKYVLSKDIGLTTFSGQAVLIVIVQE